MPDRLARNNSVPPDPTELRLRFGCGALVGGLAGGLGAVPLFDGESLPLIGAMVILAALLCGVLARRWGDIFWQRFPWWLVP